MNLTNKCDAWLAQSSAIVLDYEEKFGPEDFNVEAFLSGEGELGDHNIRALTTINNRVFLLVRMRHPEMDEGRPVILFKGIKEVDTLQEYTDFPQTEACTVLKNVPPEVMYHILEEATDLDYIPPETDIFASKDFFNLMRRREASDAPETPEI